MSIPINSSEVNLNFREELNSYKGIASKEAVAACSYRALALFYMNISSTTGGSGTSLLENGNHTSDGYEILKHINIAEYDQFTNSIKEQLIKVVKKVSSESGDGTSTIVTLLALLYFSSEKYNLALDYNKVHLDNAFKFVSKLLYKNLEDASIEVNADTLRKGLIIAANNNTKFGDKLFKLLYGNLSDKFSFKTSVVEDPEMEFDDIDFIMERYNGLQIPVNTKGVIIYENLYRNAIQGHLDDSYSIVHSDLIKYTFKENDVSLYLCGELISEAHVRRLVELIRSKGLNVKVILYQISMNADIASYLNSEGIFFNDACVTPSNAGIVDMIKDAGGNYRINRSDIENMCSITVNDEGEVVDSNIKPTLDVCDFYGIYEYVKLHKDGRVFLCPKDIETINANDSLVNTRIKNLIKQTEDKMKKLDIRINNQKNEMDRNLAMSSKRGLQENYDALFSEKININMRVGSGINVKKYADLMDDAMKVYKSFIYNKRVVNGGLFASYDAIYKLKTQVDNMPKDAVEQHPEFNSMSTKKLKSLLSKVVGTIEMAFSNFIYDLMEKYDYDFIRTDFESLTNLLKYEKTNPFAIGGRLCLNLLTKERSTEESPVVIPVPLNNEIMVLDAVFSTLTSILGISSAQLMPETPGKLVKINGVDPRSFVTNLGYTIFNVVNGIIPKPNNKTKEIKVDKPQKFKQPGKVSSTKYDDSELKYRKRPGKYKNAPSVDKPTKKSFNNNYKTVINNKVNKNLRKGRI